jgi:hypothetical protein
LHQVSQKGYYPSSIIPKLALALEMRLFHTAPSLHEYADVSTLKLRIWLLVTSSIRRRSKQKIRFKRVALFGQVQEYNRFEEVSRLMQDVKELNFKTIVRKCVFNYQAGNLREQKPLPQPE